MASPKSVQGLLGARRCHGICLSFPEAGLSRRGPAKASHHARLVATLPRECQLLSGSRAVDPGEEEQGAGTGFRRTAPSSGWLSAPERSLPVDVSLRAQHGAGGHTRSFLGSLALPMFTEHALCRLLGVHRGSEHTHRADPRGAYMLVEKGATHDCERTAGTKATKRVTWCLPDIGEFNRTLEVRKST